MKAAAAVLDDAITPAAAELSRELGRRARADREIGFGRALSRAGLLMMAALMIILGTMEITDRSADARHDADIAAIQEALRTLCPAVPAGQKTPAAADTCARAQRYDTAQPVAPGPPGPQGAAGQPGPPPSQDQIRLAVTTYCASGACTGPAGATPTREQVAAAVVAYCATGACTGGTGAPGADGKNGEPGPAGTPATDEQVAAAVDTYCSAGACAGPAGPQGAAGEQGRGIAGIAVHPSGTQCVMTVTYTDATTQDVPVATALCLTISKGR